MTRTTARCLALLVALVVGTMIAVPVQADAYRGWTLFQRSDTGWNRVAQGPALVPDDGTLLGWRLSLSQPDFARFPRGSLTFAQICGATPTESGQKRVAVVIDYGRRVDYDDQGQPPVPRAVCASVPSSATAADALADVSRTRVASGKVCAVDDFPQSGCGDEVADADIPSAALQPDSATSVALPATSADDVRNDGGLPFLAWAAIVIVLACGVLGGLAWRRRRATAGEPGETVPENGRAEDFTYVDDQR